MLYELAAPSSRAIVSQIALILDHLTPHLGRGGAPALLVLCQRVALAGGAMTLSESDLLRLIGCSSSTLTAMKRLNDELGLLIRLPGESVRRRGPAPGRWMLALPIRTASVAGAVSPLDREAEVTADERDSPPGREVEPPHQCQAPPAQLARGEPVVTPDPDPDHHVNNYRSDPGSADDLIARLIQSAAARTGERWLARSTRALGPLLRELVQAGWSAAAVQHLVDEAIAATIAYQPAHPTSYLVTVLRQRLRWCQSADARPPLTRPQPARSTAELARARPSSSPTPISRPAGALAAAIPVPDEPPVQPTRAHEPGHAQSRSERGSVAAPSVAWCPPAAITGLPCSPPAALQAALAAAGLSNEAYLRGAQLAGWEPAPAGGTPVLLVGTPTVVPDASARRIAPLLGHGLSAIVGRSVGCRLMPLATSLPIQAAHSTAKEELAPAGVSAPAGRLVG